MPISLFSRIFGSKRQNEDVVKVANPEPNIPSVSASVDTLVSQQDFLTRRISLLERQIEDQRRILKAHIEKGGDKTKAKTILSEIKKKETETTKLTAQLLNLEAVEKALIEARLQKEITQAIQGASKTLKNERICVEEVEKVMDDAQDLIDSQQESSDILSRRFVTNTTYQEDEEIEAELNSLFASSSSKEEIGRGEVVPIRRNSSIAVAPPPSSCSSKASSSKAETEKLLLALES